MKKIAFFGDGLIDRYTDVVGVKTDPAGAQTYVRGVSAEYPGGALYAASALEHFCEVEAYAPVMVEIERFKHGEQLLPLRIDTPRRYAHLEEHRRDVVQALTAGDYAAVVVSDYRKGMVDRGTLDRITAYARYKQIPCVIDAKARIHGADLTGATIKCNLKEYPEVGRTVHVVTRGPLPPLVRGHEVPAVRFPTLPYQECGAGDVYTAFLAYYLARDHTLHLAAEFAYHAAAAAGYYAPFREAVLPREVAAIANPGRLKILEDDDELLEWCQHRASGRVVVTNGCFDLLHIGHMQNLAEARAEGDQLLVLVNSDSSVEALKGPGRPYIRLDRRMGALAGLEAVTAVASFSEPTPERVLQTCMRAMTRKFACLVKGPGVQNVPGTEYAERLHITADYGLHTSDIAAQMRR